MAPAALGSLATLHVVVNASADGGRAAGSSSVIAHDWLWSEPLTAQPIEFRHDFSLTAVSTLRWPDQEGDVDAPSADTAHSDEDLAKKLNNPVSDLISVPFQNNIDFGLGPNDAIRYTLNVQPVIPISISKDWHLISRTIVPVIYQEELFDGDDDEFGIGDITQSLFFSPKASVGGWTWGAGPVFLIPTATDDELGTKKWGIGPTAVVLRQIGPWTYGILANHIWSFAGDDDRADVNSTFLQPFLAYTTKKAFTLTLNTESTYDWETEQWTVPINLIGSQLLRIGDQSVQVGLGGRWFVEKPDSGPEWGIRFVVTLLFPT
jgi:hypothetical protein